MAISGAWARLGAFLMAVSGAYAGPASWAGPTADAGWQAVSQPGGYMVARVGGSGLANGLALTCERGVAVLAVNLQRPAPTNPVRLTIDIGKERHPVVLTRNGRTNVWVASMANQTPIDAMLNGTTASISTNGQSIGSFSLAGANAAIRKALAACYSPASTVSVQGPLHAAPVSQGFGGVVEGKGCPPTGPVARWGSANVQDYNGSNSIFCGDFTGDGKADAFAVIRYALGANNFGQEAVLFHNIGGQLRFLRRVPEFYGMPEAAKFAEGRITIDMTTMLPTDARCCPTGKEIHQIDTASGRHWQLVDAKPTAAAGGRTGPLSKLPIALGPYVASSEPCRAPSQVTWFEPGGYWEIARDSRFFSEIAKVTRDGADYLLEGKQEPGDAEDYAIAVRPAGPGRIVLIIQDDVPMKLCKPDEIPAGYRP